MPAGGGGERLKYRPRWAASMGAGPNRVRRGGLPVRHRGSSGSPAICWAWKTVLSEWRSWPAPSCLNRWETTAWIRGLTGIVCCAVGAVWIAQGSGSSVARVCRVTASSQCWVGRRYSSGWRCWCGRLVSGAGRRTSEDPQGRCHRMPLHAWCGPGVEPNNPAGRRPTPGDRSAEIWDSSVPSRRGRIFFELRAVAVVASPPAIRRRPAFPRHQGSPLLPSRRSRPCSATRAPTSIIHQLKPSRNMTRPQTRGRHRQTVRGRSKGAHEIRDRISRRVLVEQAGTKTRFVLEPHSCCRRHDHPGGQRKVAVAMTWPAGRLGALVVSLDPPRVGRCPDAAAMYQVEQT